MDSKEYSKRLEAIKKLPPSERIKKIKDLEEDRKKALEKESKKVVEDSIKEIVEEGQTELKELEAAIRESEERYIKEQEIGKERSSIEQLAPGYNAGSNYLAGQKEASITELYNRLHNLGDALNQGYQTLESASDIYNQIVDYASKSEQDPRTALEAKKIKSGAQKIMEQIGMYFASDDMYDP